LLAKHILRWSGNKQRPRRPYLPRTARLSDDLDDAGTQGNSRTSLKAIRR
jgi:hypothetical protein